jgi:hypothetical protein
MRTNNKYSDSATSLKSSLKDIPQFLAFPSVTVQTAPIKAPSPSRASQQHQSVATLTDPDVARLCVSSKGRMKIGVNDTDILEYKCSLQSLLHENKLTPSIVPQQIE